MTEPLLRSLVMCFVFRSVIQSNRTLIWWLKWSDVMTLHINPSKIQFWSKPFKREMHSQAIAANTHNTWYLSKLKITWFFCGGKPKPKWFSAHSVLQWPESGESVMQSLLSIIKTILSALKSMASNECPEHALMLTKASLSATDWKKVTDFSYKTLPINSSDNVLNHVFRIVNTLITLILRLSTILMCFTKCILKC